MLRRDNTLRVTQTCCKGNNKGQQEDSKAVLFSCRELGLGLRMSCKPVDGLLQTDTTIFFTNIISFVLGNKGCYETIF